MTEMLEQEGGLARLDEPTVLKRREDWVDYRLWNLAVCDHFFSGQFAHQPVYIDIDESTRNTLMAKHVGKGDAIAHLVGSVKATLTKSTGNPYSAHVDNDRGWTRAKKDGCPPYAGLLAFFSLVAERMVASEDFAPNNYYGRLYRMLGFQPGLEDAFQRGYRETAARLWSSLNEWLAEAGGARGYPTARALDHRKYVSIAISQALVRQHDRLLLRRIFSEVGLEPRQRIQLPEMKSILLSWVTARHGSTSLARLLSRGPDVQERVADIATSELEAWDGRVNEGDRSSQTRLLLVAELRIHPLPRIDLYLGVSSAAGKLPTSYQLRNPSSIAQGAFASTRGRVRLEPVENLGLLAIEPWSEIRAGDAILTRLELAPVEGAGPNLIRSGDAIAVLTFRPTEQVYREVTQPSLMERLLVLAHESIVPVVNRHLERCARPGFRLLRAGELRNLPERWAAFVDVQIAQRLEVAGMESLTPISDRQLLLSRGMAVGRDTWHTAVAPEILVAAPVGQKFHVELRQSIPLGDPVTAVDFGSFEGAAAISLQERGLPDGDYEVLVRLARGGGQPESSEHAHFRLRSSDNAVARQFVLDGKSLVRICSDQQFEWMLSATPADYLPGAWMNAIQGCVVGAAAKEWPFKNVEQVPTEPSFRGGGDADLLERRSLTATTTQNIGSCVARGYHYFELPFVRPGTARGELVRATCAQCQVEIWHRVGGIRPRRQAAPRRGRNLDDGARVRTAVASLSRHEVQSKLHAAIFDAINYMRGGSFNRLAALLAPVDDSPWAGTSFLLRLSALGHVETRTDLASAKIISWQVAPTTLVRTSGTQYVLTGWRSARLITVLERLVTSRGGGCNIEGQESSLPVVEVRINPEHVDNVCAGVLDESGCQVIVVHDFPFRLVRVLPSLSLLISHLPKARPASIDLERFNFNDARWTPATDLDVVGAYRSRARGTSYFYLSPEGLPRKEGLIADVRTVKYLAARALGRSLYAYSESDRCIRVPYGCELPGLLERVAVMCSGKLPTQKDGYVVYQGVPKDIGYAIWSRLVN